MREVLKDKKHVDEYWPEKNKINIFKKFKLYIYIYI